MIKTTLMGGVVGGVVAFVWLSISWMVLPWHHQTIHAFPEGKAARLAALLRSSAAKDGVYMIPYRDGEQHVEGELYAFMTIKKNGIQENMAMQMLRALLFYILIAAIMTRLLVQADLIGFIRRTKFIKMAGLSGAMFTLFNNWNWLGFSDMYILVNLIDAGVTFGLMSLVIHWITPSQIA